MGRKSRGSFGAESVTGAVTVINNPERDMIKERWLDTEAGCTREEVWGYRGGGYNRLHLVTEGDGLSMHSGKITFLPP